MESAGRCPSTSSVSSVSLLDVKEETRLVLQAFLHRTAAIPLRERPGPVGGAYRDHTKYSTKPLPKAKENFDSQAEDVSSADDKSKTGLMGFIKQLPRRSATQRPSKDTNRNSKAKPFRDLTDDDVISPSSTSDEEDNDKKQQKTLSRKKIKRRISQFFKKKMEKEKEKEQAPLPSRPNTLPIIKFPETPPTINSPSHPPKFYDKVAEKLEQIAYRSSSTKTPTSESTQVCNNEVVVQRLVHLLSLEGDSINTKIESDPFLRSNLSRLSYPSFARLMDAVSSTQVGEISAPLPTASPTLRRIAVTMEVSRRIVTATGAQRMQGYAECYMETFAPWVKSQGGWENVDLGEHEQEYD